MKLGWFGAGSGRSPTPRASPTSPWSRSASATSRSGSASTRCSSTRTSRRRRCRRTASLLDLVPALAFAARTSTIRLYRHRHPPAPQPGDVRQGDGLGRRALRRPRRRGSGSGTCPASTRPWATTTRRGRRADECVDALRSLWERTLRRFAGEHAALGRPVPPATPAAAFPIHASGMSTAARRRAVACCQGWRVLPHRRAHLRRPRGAGAPARRGGSPRRAGRARDHHHPAADGARRRHGARHEDPARRLVPMCAFEDMAVRRTPRRADR